MSVIALFIACENSLNRVVGVHDKINFEKFKNQELDKSYKNLLNPNNTTEEEYKAIINSWKEYHTKVSSILQENNFSWGVKDPSVTIFNKIYFNKEGKVNHILVNVKNEKVSNEVKSAYVTLLKNHINELSINLKRGNQFAQCGKIKYKNYE
ncbi:hypothetical protein [Tenacibaculum jejuense]|uniref:Uncharacterized protein n=1 Tax=Tenacibaculum jejuense TaxID=584609 RepID=A0A238U6J0_9FLAO|nr:hypothetical protein [Tenacibaculum jejuense]SNR14819.1 protein of unknown function [Tenacibaculum jejuense]